MKNNPAAYAEIMRAFRQEGNPEIARHSSRFFKTGKGDYGEGDRFLGIRVPVVRKYAKRWRGASVPVILRLMKSKFHEERLLAVIMLVESFKTGTPEERKAIYEMYIGNTRYINNWDIVDVSAHKIVGPYLQGRSQRTLHEFARSALLWERRIAIMSTFHYIRQGQYDTALKISDMLINDGEDLIHKAVGWMLREIGKRDMGVEERFLKTRYQGMPRTMLRYAIEKFPQEKRRQYLRGEV